MGLGDTLEIENAFGIRREPRELTTGGFGLAHHPLEPWPWSVDRRGRWVDERRAEVTVAVCTCEEAARAALRLLQGC